MASRLTSESLVNKAKKKSNTRATSVPNRSFQRTAKEKLRQNRAYADLDYGENELAILATELTDQESIMNKYFSEIAYKEAAERVSEHVQEQEAVFVTSQEVGASRKRSIQRVEDTAKLEVKLLLRTIDSQMTGLARTAASILRMEYGPLHTSLLINDEVLLEWNTGSLVEPERYDGVNQHYPIMTSALHRVNTVSLIKYDTKDEIDLIFEATRNKLDMLHALVKVISRYNGQYYYDAIFRNCQTFVIDALKAMGCTNPPQFQGNLKEYFENLKAGDCQPQFDGHEALDRYVRENVTNRRTGGHEGARNQQAGGQLSTQEKEYLLGQYFQYHIRGMTESEDPEDWRCPIQNCQMEQLERNIDEQSMSMHRFLRIGPGRDIQGDDT